MNIEQQLKERSNASCELCASQESLQVYEVLPRTTDNSILVCTDCEQQITNKVEMNVNHWRCLNNSMWSTVPAVQVMAWRLLTRLADEGWTKDLLDIFYLDDETLAWAKAGMTGADAAQEAKLIHKDSNGSVLQAGDTVTLIKDLDVKGAGFTAKRGTAVRNISLVEDNAGQIEGKVNGQQIVILTQYVKKSG